MLCIMSPDICTNTLGGVQSTVVAEFFRIHNSCKHTDGEDHDGAYLGSRHDSWAHLPIGMQTTAALCGTSTTGTSCRWTWRLLKS